MKAACHLACHDVSWGLLAFMLKVTTPGTCAPVHVHFVHVIYILIPNVRSTCSRVLLGDSPLNTPFSLTNFAGSKQIVLALQRRTVTSDCFHTKISPFNNLLLYVDVEHAELLCTGTAYPSSPSHKVLTVTTGL